MKTVNVFPSAYDVSKMREVVMSKFSKPPDKGWIRHTEKGKVI